MMRRGSGFYRRAWGLVNRRRKAPLLRKLQWSSFQELYTLAWARQLRDLKALVPINDYDVAAGAHSPPHQQLCGVAHLLIQLNDGARAQFQNIFYWHLLLAKAQGYI